MEYPYKYEVKVYDSSVGEYVINRIFDDEDAAKYWANHLKGKNKKVHIQQSFKDGGVVPAKDLYSWANNIAQTNLLRWSGYDSESDYEYIQDKPFDLSDFVKENQQELSYIYKHPSKYGLDRHPILQYSDGGPVQLVKFPIGIGEKNFLKILISYENNIK